MVHEREEERWWLAVAPNNIAKASGESRQLKGQRKNKQRPQTPRQLSSSQTASATCQNTDGSVPMVPRYVFVSSKFIKPSHRHCPKESNISQMSGQG